MEHFKNPPSEFRPMPFWSWNEKLDTEEVKRQIREMAGKGWGGYACHSRVGLVTGYLSEQWMEMIKVSIEEGRKTGTYVILYDEDKWPSGYASGILAADERHRDRSIVLAKRDEIEPGDTVLKHFVHDSVEYVVCRHIMPTGDEWFNGSTYADLMNPETVKAFIASTHEKYKETCGDHFGSEISSIFTDEPCYFMKKYYKDNRFINMRGLPWSECLPEYFEKLKGYSIFDHIEELFLNINDYQKTRFDYYDAATRLFVESFTKQYADWCRENHLKMTGHYMGEDTISLQTQYIGAAMPHYEYMQWPGIDKLSRHVRELVTAKQLTSVTDQLDKERAFCECFGCMGQHTSFFHRKWIADWQAALGINFVNHHLSLYSMRGERKRDYPPNFFYQQPWWDCEKPFADYIGRLSYAITQGRLNVDILVIHPISNAWCNYTPLEEYEASLSVINDAQTQLDSLAGSLAGNKLDFHFGDEILMEKYAKVEDGKLVVGSYSYSTVIVPSMLTLRENTYKLLMDFMTASGDNTLVFLTPMPERLNGVVKHIRWPDRAATASSIQEAVDILDRKYPERISIRNIADGSNVEKMLVHERTADDGKYVFLAYTDERMEVRTRISVKCSQDPIVLDLFSGNAFDIPFERVDDRVVIQVKFMPAGSLLLYFPNCRPEVSTVPAVLDSGVEFAEGFERITTVSCNSYALNEPNVLKLDHLTLTMDGQEVLNKEIVPKAWFDIYYKAKDGTPFKAEYEFCVSNIPSGDLIAVIEMAENLDSIRLNGTKLQPLKRSDDPLRLDVEKNWKDLSFTKVPFEASLLKQGRNVLTIEGRKVNNITGQGTHRHVENYQNYQPTELEDVYIVGDFLVRDEERKRFFIDGKKTDVCAADITSAGYPFYAGSMIVHYCFELKDEATLIRLKDVNAACSEVCVNGLYAGVKYWYPYTYDVDGLLKKGMNTVSVKIYTTLFNLMGPNHIEDVLDRTGVGTYTFVDWKKYTDRYVLLPFGVGDLEILR